MSASTLAPLAPQYQSGPVEAALGGGLRLLLWTTHLGEHVEVYRFVGANGPDDPGAVLFRDIREDRQDAAQAGLDFSAGYRPD